MGFASQLDAILASVPPTRQTLLFSATMPSLLADFTRAKLHEPELVRLDLETKISDALSITFFKVRPQEKLGALLVVLGELLDRQQQTIVFVSTRHHVELIHELLTTTAFQSAAIYGSLDPAARKIALGKFRAGKARALAVEPCIYIYIYIYVYVYVYIHIHIHSGPTSLAVWYVKARQSFRVDIASNAAAVGGSYS